MKDDIFVKCTRCRNEHLKSERKESAPDKHGLITLVCPRCGGHSFYQREKPAQAPKSGD